MKTCKIHFYVKTKSNVFEILIKKNSKNNINENGYLKVESYYKSNIIILHRYTLQTSLGDDI